MPEANTHKMLTDSLFPREVVTEEADVKLIRGACYPEEEECVRNAVLGRKQEFAAGRLCARRALARVGIDDFPLLVGNNREPVWPTGITGSVSHSGEYCAVAVARKTSVEALGLDIEATVKLDSGSLRQICTRQELSWIDSLPCHRARIGATLIFSAKECLYKCQYAVTGRWLNFHDVTISVDPDIGEFTATFLVNVGGFFNKGTSVRGRYVFCRGYVSTGMWIPRAEN